MRILKHQVHPKLFQQRSTMACVRTSVCDLHDHPVCANFGSFATLLLIAQPPLLRRRGIGSPVLTALIKTTTAAPGPWECHSTRCENLVPGRVRQALCGY